MGPRRFCYRTPHIRTFVPENHRVRNLTKYERIFYLPWEYSHIYRNALTAYFFFLMDFVLGFSIWLFSMVLVIPPPGPWPDTARNYSCMWVTYDTDRSDLSSRRTSPSRPRLLYVSKYRSRLGLVFHLETDHIVSCNQVKDDLGVTVISPSTFLMNTSLSSPILNDHLEIERFTLLF